MSAEVLALLEEMRAEIRDLRQTVDDLRCVVDAGLEGQLAPESDNEDPQVRFKPFDWTGPNFIGKKFSECAPEFLDGLARQLAYFAEKEEREKKLTRKGNPEWPLTLQKAARARRWALRIRLGQVVYTPQAAGSSPGPAAPAFGGANMFSKPAQAPAAQPAQQLAPDPFEAEPSAFDSDCPF